MAVSKALRKAGQEKFKIQRSRTDFEQPETKKDDRIMPGQNHWEPALRVEP
jgi:hypothetical protein